MNLHVDAWYKGNHNTEWIIRGSKHVTRNQKGCWMLNIISQNQTFIYLLPFQTIIIMAS